MKKPVKDHNLRYLSLVALFCIVAVIYLGRLFYIQISGREGSYDTSYTRRTVTVQAVRGELYDRNGKVLVKNADYFRKANSLLELSYSPDAFTDCSSPDTSASTVSSRYEKSFSKLIEADASTPNPKAELSCLIRPEE